MLHKAFHDEFCCSMDREFCLDGQNLKKKEEQQKQVGNSKAAAELFQQYWKKEQWKGEQFDWIGELRAKRAMLNLK